MSTTLENLAIAFAGESQANRKYLAFAREADREGFPQIARLFRAAADAETVHALAHLGNMGGIGTTGENLRAAVAGEVYEFTEMYPPMVAQAEAEDHKARRGLRYATAAEKVHATLFQQALDAMTSGRDLAQMDVYVCPTCGHIEFGAPPEECPICGAPPSKFRKVA
jgi:rubrerythrin